MLMPDFENVEGRLAAYRIVRDFFRGLFGRGVDRDLNGALNRA